MISNLESLPGAPTKPEPLTELTLRVPTRLLRAWRIAINTERAKLRPGAPAILTEPEEQRMLTRYLVHSLKVVTELANDTNRALKGQPALTVKGGAQ